MDRIKDWVLGHILHIIIGLVALLVLLGYISSTIETNKVDSAHLSQLSEPGRMLYDYIIENEGESAAGIAYMADIIYSEYEAGYYD